MQSKRITNLLEIGKRSAAAAPLKPMKAKEESDDENEEVEDKKVEEVKDLKVSSASVTSASSGPPKVRISASKEYKEMSNEQLRNECKIRGFTIKGKQEELIKKLETGIDPYKSEKSPKEKKTDTCKPVLKIDNISIEDKECTSKMLKDKLKELKFITSGTKELLIERLKQGRNITTGDWNKSNPGQKKDKKQKFYVVRLTRKDGSVEVYKKKGDTPKELEIYKKAAETGNFDSLIGPLFEFCAKDAGQVNKSSLSNYNDWYNDVNKLNPPIDITDVKGWTMIKAEEFNFIDTKRVFCVNEVKQNS